MISTDTSRRVASYAAVLISALAADVRAQPAENLFMIARNKNANIVRYDIHRNADGQLNVERPVDSYWLLLAENGRREDLTWMERELAYGHSTGPVGRSGFTLQLQAFRQREIQVVPVGKTYRAYVTIAGKKAILNRIFVHADGSGLLPTVRYVELQGIGDNGAHLIERISAARDTERD